MGCFFDPKLKKEFEHFENIVHEELSKLTEKLYTDYAYHVFEIDENATSEQKN